MRASRDSEGQREETTPLAGRTPLANRDVGRAGPPGRHTIAPDEAIAEAELAEAPKDLPWSTTGWRWRVLPVVAISLGAVLGASARYAVGQWAATRWPGPFPWGTLLINVTGSLIIGFYLTLVTERFTGRAMTRLFVATGFLGAYTTFSSFSDETVTLVQHGMIAVAILYVLVSLTLGLAAVVAGTLLAHAL